MLEALSPIIDALLTSKHPDLIIILHCIFSFHISRKIINVSCWSSWLCAQLYKDPVYWIQYFSDFMLTNWHFPSSFQEIWSIWNLDISTILRPPGLGARSIPLHLGKSETLPAFDRRTGCWMLGRETCESFDAGNTYFPPAFSIQPPYSLLFHVFNNLFVWSISWDILQPLKVLSTDMMIW